MPLKILGWGTMVGVAMLAISTHQIWMKPLQARAAQMVRYARSLQTPPYRSPVQRLPCVPALHAFPAVPRRTQSTTSATLRSRISGRPLRRNEPPGWELSCEPLREHHGLPQRGTARDSAVRLYTYRGRCGLPPSLAYVLPLGDAVNT